MSVSLFTQLTNPGYGKVLTGTVSVAAGDMIVLFGTYCSNQSWTGGSDDDGNTYIETAHSSEPELAVYVATAVAPNAALGVTLTMNSNRTSKAGFCVVISGGGTVVATEESTTALGTSHPLPATAITASGVVVVGVRIQNNSIDVADGATGWDESNAPVRSRTFHAYEERSTAKSGEAFTTSAARSASVLSIGIEYSGGGPVGPDGTITQTVPGFSQALAGTATVTGLITQTLPGFSQILTGTATVSGSLSQTVPGFSQTLVGTPTASGSISQTLPGFSQALTGSTGSGAVIAQTTPGMSQALTGTPTVTGALAQTVPDATEALLGTPIVTSIITSTAPGFLQLLSGSPIITGIISQVAPSFSQVLTSQKPAKTITGMVIRRTTRYSVLKRTTIGTAMERPTTYDLS